MEKNKRQITVKLTEFEVGIISGALNKFYNEQAKRLKDKYPTQTKCIKKLSDDFRHLDKVLISERFKV